MVGGALKLVDPSGTVGALRALGLPLGTDRVRVLAGVEVIFGMLAWSVGSRVLSVLVALSYAAFFGVTALFERIDDGAAGVALAVLVVVGMLIAIGVMRIGRRPWEPTGPG